jgi:hypothetical protein
MRRARLVCAGILAVCCMTQNACVTTQGRGLKTPGSPPTRAELEACTLHVQDTPGADHLVTRTYDQQGRRLQQITSPSGRPEPGAEIIDYIYDGDGRLARETRHTLPDTKIEREATYKYDRWGRLVREEVIDASEPSVARITEQQFDEFGALTGRWSYGPAPDMSPGPQLLEIVGYVWEDGRVIEERRRDPAGGVFARVLYTYNGDGLRLSREDRAITEAGERATRRVRYTWDAQGRLIEEAVEVLAADGQEPKRSQRALFEYDATGRRLRERLDRGADGSFDQIVDYDYGCMAPVPAATVIGAGDGASEQRSLEALVGGDPAPAKEPAKQPVKAAAPAKTAEPAASDAAMRAAGLGPAEPAPEPAKTAAPAKAAEEEEVDTSALWEEEGEEPAKKKKEEKKAAPAAPPAEEGWED